MPVPFYPTIAHAKENYAHVMAISKALGLSFSDACSCLQAILLTELIRVVVQPPKEVGDGPPVLIEMMMVATPGTAVQCAPCPVPRGFPVTVRMRHHTTSAGRLGYVGIGQSGVSRTDHRCEMKSNDSVSFYVPNLDWIWLDADTADTQFETIVECFER